MGFKQMSEEEFQQLHPKMRLFCGVACSKDCLKANKADIIQKVVKRRASFELIAEQTGWTRAEIRAVVKEFGLSDRNWPVVKERANAALDLLAEQGIYPTPLPKRVF